MYSVSTSLNAPPPLLFQVLRRVVVFSDNERCWSERNKAWWGSVKKIRDRGIEKVELHYPKELIEISSIFILPVRQDQIAPPASHETGPFRRH